MRKLSQKFTIGVSAILLLVTLISLFLNANYIERYFLYQEKRDLNRITDQLPGDDLGETIIELEAQHDVIIVRMANTQDNDLLNERLRAAFLNKGISLGGYGNFWLWEQDQRDADMHGRKLRIYQQEKLHYSLMVQYVGVGDDFLAIAKIIPSVTQTLMLINLVTAVIFGGAAVVMLVLILLLLKRITTPLMHIRETAQAIAGLDFQTADIKTGDELEQLAGDINHMSGCLRQAYQELDTQNRQMESLLANVSHDLKTPVSIIKAYASGLRDGMDDGSFLETILVQNEKMERMIERLLALARRQEPAMEQVDLSGLLQETLAQFQLQAQERNLIFSTEISPDLTLVADRDAVQSIFENLVSNAVKYSCAERISLLLKSMEDGVLFVIENKTAVPVDMERLWEPFYVGEASRNSEMTGTGLGLSIVRETAQSFGYACSCGLTDGMLRFTVVFGK